MRPQHARPRGRITDTPVPLVPPRSLALRLLGVVLATALVTTTVVVLATSSPVGPHHALTAALLDDSSSTTTSTDTTTDTIVPAPPAPADYGTQLDTLYSQLYAVASTLPGAVAGTGETTPDAFDSQVASADADNLGYLNQQLPESTIANITSSVGAAVPVTSGVQSALTVRQTRATVKRTTFTRVVGHPHLVNAHYTTVLIEPQALTTVPDTLPNNGPYVDDTNNSYTATCPSGAPPINSSDTYDTGDLFAIQIAIDVVNGAYNIISSPAGTPADPTDPAADIVGIALYIASAILAVISLALQIAEDTLSYFQTIAADCQEAQMQQVGIDTDNTAYQTYTLLTNVAATANETDQEVANLTNQNLANFQQQLTIDIEESLSAPVGTTPVASYETPAQFESVPLGGYLDAEPVGVAEIVASTITAMQETGATMSPQATRDQTLAEQALAAGQFKLSFDYFRLAYQAAAG